jgi:hypothetical protein
MGEPPEKPAAVTLADPLFIQESPCRRCSIVVYLALACRGAVGVVFLVSVFGKLHSRLAFRAFASWLAALPVPLARSQPRAAAAVIAAAEALIVVLIALQWTGRVGLVLAAVLLAVFTAGTLLAVARGSDAPCRCFGASTLPLGWRHAVRDALLGAAAVAGAVAAVRARQP